MKMITQVLTEKVSDTFEKCGYSKNLGLVTVSDRIDLCQFQCNGAFAGAKIYKKSPASIANDVALMLLKDKMFKKVEIAQPGFINIILTDEYLIEYVGLISQDTNLGIPQADSLETILLDYGGPNVAKPLHIGHLRSAIIGESLKRLIKSTGRKAISDVHLGDWGLQIGLVIAEFEERNPDWKCFSGTFNSKTDMVTTLSTEVLNEIYPFASRKSKDSKEFKQKAQAITAELQKGRAGYIALWKEIIRVSVEDLKRNYKKLNVDFDFWYGESDSEKYIDQLIISLTDKGLLYESEGAMVVDVSEDLDKAPVPPVIIKKSNNSNIYATTDLATIIQRQKDFSPDKIWYVVDSRQSLHFTQVFRCAKKAKLVPAETDLEHLGFGTMNGSDGKPYKTRDGGVMQLAELLETVVKTTSDRTNSSYFDTKELKAEVVQKLAIAAIKFGDLINHRLKDYIFDLDKFLASEGKTGTFLLYTVARINSVLKKLNCYNSDNICLSNVYTEVERELLLKIILSGEAFLNAFSEKAPNFICENAYQLASAFSKFYHENHILHEPDNSKKKTWISLCVLTRKMLMKHLDVLGIEAVEFM